MCRDSPGCVDLAVRRRAFARALRSEVAIAEVDRLRVTLGSGAGALGDDAGLGSGDPVP